MKNLQLLLSPSDVHDYVLALWRTDDMTGWQHFSADIAPVLDPDREPAEVALARIRTFSRRMHVWDQLAGEAGDDDRQYRGKNRPIDEKLGHRNED